MRIGRLLPPSVSCLIGEQEKVTCGKFDIMRTELQTWHGVTPTSRVLNQSLSIV